MMIKDARSVFRRAFASTLHYAFATVDADGAPHVTPIGSFVLVSPEHGIFFEVFASGLAKNLDRDPRVAILGVDASRSFWVRSLLAGRFARPPALRLIGRVSPAREATPDDVARFTRRIRFLRRLPGARILWGDMRRVRDVSIERVEPIRLGATTRHLFT
jgi:hypothetical protein